MGEMEGLSGGIAAAVMTLVICNNNAIPCFSSSRDQVVSYTPGFVLSFCEANLTILW